MTRTHAIYLRKVSFFTSPINDYTVIWISQMSFALSNSSRMSWNKVSAALNKTETPLIRKMSQIESSTSSGSTFVNRQMNHFVTKKFMLKSFDYKCA